MRFRALPVLMLSALLAACSLQPENSTTPTSAPTTAASEPTTAAAPTAASEPTVAAAPTTASEPTAAAPTTTSQTSSDYETADCPFDAPSGVTVECGYLTVPENRTNGSSKTIRLAVGVFKTSSNNPKPDPIVYLEGWAENFEQIFAPIAGDRDFIIFDQRGTGFSEPVLACTEVTDEAYAELDKQLSIAESTQRITDATLKCHDRLAGEGIDLSAYNSMESAADLDALRQALGYDTWNVYGISYGTRLALTEMREFPQGIRSVILDSVVPLQSGESDTPANIDRAFRAFFDGCAKDTACNTAYPDLETTFYTLVDTLNANPVTQQVTDPTDGKSYDVLLSGDGVFGGLIFALYQTSAIPLMPRAIADAAAGTDYSLLARLAYFSTAQYKDISFGMFYSVRCNEEIPFETPEQLTTADDQFPRQRGLLDLTSFVQVCDAWGAGKAPVVENQAVNSDIPTLVLAGEYDPATPPADSETASETLSNSYFFEFPGYGHGVSVDGDCAVGITTAFLDTPTSAPDSSCIADLGGPAFVVPEGPVVLTDFENSDAGVKGVVPEGWEKAGTIAYANASGDSAILEFQTTLDQQQTLNLITQQFSLDGDPQDNGQYTDKSQRQWSLYKVGLQGSPGNLAVTETSGGTLVVMLVSPASAEQELYDTLFLPALDAIEPLG